jgi:hypothetical protein
MPTDTSITSDQPAERVDRRRFNKAPWINTARVFYCEQSVNEWCRAQIKGVPWTPNPELPEKPKFINKREMLNRVGLSFVTCWKLEKEGRFPKRYRLASKMEAVDA